MTLQNQITVQSVTIPQTLVLPIFFQSNPDRHLHHIPINPSSPSRPNEHSPYIQHFESNTRAVVISVTHRYGVRLC